MYVRVASSSFAVAGFDYLEYIVPEGMELEVGDLVSVPLRQRVVIGYVIALMSTSKLENHQLIVDKVTDGNKLTSELIELAHFISSNFFCPLSKVVLSMVPSVMTNKIKEYYKISSNYDNSIVMPRENELLQEIKENSGFLGKLDDSTKRLLRSLIKKAVVSRHYLLEKSKITPKLIKSVILNKDADISSLTDKQKALTDYLSQKTDFIPTSFLIKNKVSSTSIINNLISKNILIVDNIREDRIPDFAFISKPEITFTEGQEEAYNTIKESIDNKTKDIFLLHGVTASGKTEVYISLIKDVIESGRTVIVLLPEIALTTQVMNIFKSRFNDLVAVLHSNLSNGERLDEWDRIKSGRVKIVLGARSAIFAPITNIGLIVIDEEHDGCYKQDIAPRYHARDLAIFRAAKHNGVCVFGSATPSVESYYKALNGEYKLVEMPDRVCGRELPSVYIADLKEEKENNNFITKVLHDKILDRLNKKEQVILLQNRRAFSTFIMCKDCAWVAKCKNCDVSLKYHLDSGNLTCHHCGYTMEKIIKCPDCGSLQLKALGVGTQRVESYIKEHFSGVRILRMDRDTTSTKNAHADIINAFRNKKADILIGTQMVAKGLDFPNVTLVGIINADMDLNMPDFRASERTFQLVNQVSGRAGRGSIAGEVIIQTFSPDNYILKCATNHDYKSFYENEIADREQLEYPPFSRIIKVSVMGEKSDVIKDILNDFHLKLTEDNTKTPVNMIIYPVMPSLIPKIKNIYKFNLIIRTFDFNGTKSLILNILKNNIEIRKKVFFDIDPMFLD